VIKTAAVAGLAYAGAYMAAAGTTPGAYDSSRRSQASSTGSRYCDTRETDPLKYKCTAEFFNGNKVNNGAEAQSKVAIRNYWCCPASDLGGKYIGDMNGVCGSQNNGVSVFASQDQGSGGCVYHGPCIGGVNGLAAATANQKAPQPTSAPAGGTQKAISVIKISGSVPGSGTGYCNDDGNDGLNANMVLGIFGGTPGGYGRPVVGSTPTLSEIVDNAADANGRFLGASSGLAKHNGVTADTCCMKTDQGKDGTFVYDLTPSTLIQPISFCTSDKFSNSDYTCN